MSGWEWLVVIVLFLAWEHVDHARAARRREAAAASGRSEADTTTPKKGPDHGSRVR